MQVTHLTMGLEEPHPHILNLFDPLSLESLTLPGPDKYPEFDVRRLENLKALTIGGGSLNPIQDFLHIQKLELTVESISDEEILEIKERMKYSNPGTSMKISVVPEPEPELLRLQVRLLICLPQTGRKLQSNVIIT
uniref:FTH domain-containing protein n=1 Tax=Caenorhabditis tropicalis TaxID=1561998 RepID=A0A1I7UTG1_9PELO